MNLSWQPGFSTSRKPSKRPVPRRKAQHRFQFVIEEPQRGYSGRHALSPYPLIRSGSLCNSQREHLTIADPRTVSCQSESVEETDPSFEKLNDESFIRNKRSPDLESHGKTTSAYLTLCSNQDRFTCSSSNELTTISASTNDPYRLSVFVPPTIEYSNLTQRFQPVLDRYNSEFCTIPLTFHLRINPFRYRTDLDPEPKFLVHAVMALAGHHVNSTLTLSHRHTALQLLRQVLDTCSVADTIYSLLDTIVILFSLDETQSMLGSWSTHLVGACNLIEACGGINALAMSSRVEAQLGILTWWDAIISLLSREDCVFPYTYFDAVLSNQHEREWDFFGLCGCPTSLAKIVMRVARLGAERQKTPDFLFDNSVISEIEQSLESWSHIPAGTAFQNEDCMHHDNDVMHCSEAWRNGLLLYIFRVFQWKPGNTVPMHILHRAKVIVDHVVSCRDVNMISRQALLPLFFAGCELRDRSTRSKILDLCSIWDERTRYHMFASTIPLLEEVWAEQEMKSFENVWWGQIVDRQHTSNAHPLKMRLCFG